MGGKSSKNLKSSLAWRNESPNEALLNEAIRVLKDLQTEAEEMKTRRALLEDEGGRGLLGDIIDKLNLDPKLSKSGPLLFQCQTHAANTLKDLAITPDTKVLIAELGVFDALARVLRGQVELLQSGASGDLNLCSACAELLAFVIDKSNRHRKACLARTVASEVVGEFSKVLGATRDEAWLKKVLELLDSLGDEAVFCESLVGNGTVDLLHAVVQQSSALRVATMKVLSKLLSKIDTVKHADAVSSSDCFGFACDCMKATNGILAECYGENVKAYSDEQKDAAEMECATSVSLVCQLLRFLPEEPSKQELIPLFISLCSPGSKLRVLKQSSMQGLLELSANQDAAGVFIDNIHAIIKLTHDTTPEIRYKAISMLGNLGHTDEISVRLLSVPHNTEDEKEKNDMKDDDDGEQENRQGVVLSRIFSLLLSSDFRDIQYALGAVRNLSLTPQIKPIMAEQGLLEVLSSLLTIPYHNLNQNSPVLFKVQYDTVMIIRNLITRQKLGQAARDEAAEKTNSDPFTSFPEIMTVLVRTKARQREDADKDVPPHLLPCITSLIHSQVDRVQWEASRTLGAICLYPEGADNLLNPTSPAAVAMAKLDGAESLPTKVSLHHRMGMQFLLLWCRMVASGHALLHLEGARVMHSVGTSSHAASLASLLDLSRHFQCTPPADKTEADEEGKKETMEQRKSRLEQERANELHKLPSDFLQALGILVGSPQAECRKFALEFIANLMAASKACSWVKSVGEGFKGLEEVVGKLKQKLESKEDTLSTTKEPGSGSSGSSAQQQQVMQLLRILQQPQGPQQTEEEKRLELALVEKTLKSLKRKE